MILQEFHDIPSGRHAGINRTLALIVAQFWWKGLSTDVGNYVRGCLICQQAKYRTQLPSGLMQPLPLLSQIWQDIAMDFIIGLPPSNGCSIVMVIVVRLSKFAHFIALPIDFIAKKVAKLFVQHVVKIHGLPQSIILDRDKVFTSKFWQELFKK